MHTYSHISDPLIYRILKIPNQCMFYDSGITLNFFLKIFSAGKTDLLVPKLALCILSKDEELLYTKLC
jgi:hypothetical protein